MDDKGPMVAAIYALAALKDAGFAPSKRIRLLFGTNEETGCGDMSWYVSHGGDCRCTASRRTANTRSSTAKRAFSTALTAESCTRPAITA